MARKIILCLLLLVAGFLSMSRAIAKCVHHIIYVQGNVAKAANQKLAVKIVVSPDPNWEPQPEVVLAEGKLTGEVYFDATKSEGRRRDNCSRAPETVDVILLQDGREVDRARLDVAKDFVRDPKHNYRLRSPISLTAK
jgi:hypothetical protein